jgi:hypothetical protein
MTKKDKHSTGPKTNKGKAVSSRNSTTNGLTARRWLNTEEQARLNQIGELSGHSFRVGAALDLLDKNIPLEKIMLRGGWKSETSAMRYLQSWSDQDWLIIPSHHS